MIRVEVLKFRQLTFGVPDNMNTTSSSPTPPFVFRSPRALLLPILCFIGSAEISAQLSYPAIRTEAFDTVIYGVRLHDDFFWMERTASSAEVSRAAQEQTQFTRSILNELDTADQLADELYEGLAVIDDEIWNVSPVRDGYYFNKYIPEEGTWLCYGDETSPEITKVLQRIEIKGKRYAIRSRVFAYNKPLVAFMLTESGEANPHIRIFNLNTKEFLADSIAPVMFNDSRGVSMAWSQDDDALFYTQAPPTPVSHERYYRGTIRMHKVGTEARNDKPIFGFGVQSGISLQPHETPYVYTFQNSPYVIARIRAGDNDNYAFAVHGSSINGAETPWKRLEGYVNLGDAFDADGKTLYAVTTGAPRYQVVRIDLEEWSSPAPFLREQQDVIAGTDMMFNAAVVAARDVVYVLMRRVGAMKILMIDRLTGAITHVPIPKEGTIAGMKRRGTNDLVFAFMSGTSSSQYFRYDFDNRRIVALPFANNVHDASDWLATRVIHVPSRDGRNIPVSLIYPRNVNLYGNNPLILGGYGNGGASRDLYLDPHYFPWFKRGGVWAYAHVRGGGELGETWTNEGQFPNKMNSIHDFVDVAEYFVNQGYTSAQKQVVMGGSAGGFLVGMAVNQRPDLFAAGLFLSGLPDIATHTDAAFGREQKSVGPRTTKEGWLSNLSVSSIYNVPAHAKLPAMLVVHGATDYTLATAPAVRYTGRLRQAQKGNRAILLMVHPQGGHLGGTEEMIDLLKFSLWQTGHPHFQRISATKQ